MKQHKWFVAGDIDGFFGLMMDNLIQLLVLVGLCVGVCGFPIQFVFGTVLPGIAVSLIIGNFAYSYFAYKLAVKEGRDDVTALPYGINTVSLFAFVFFVMLPVYRSTGDYKLAWKIGLVASVLSGLIEFLGSFIADLIRKITPRGALLSALSGIAITFISMDFVIRTFQNPILAFVPLAIILIQFFGKVVFPFKIPGGFISVLVGSGIAWMAGLWGDPIMKSENVSKSFEQMSFYLPVLSLGDIFSALFDNTGKEHFFNPAIKDYASIIIPMGLFNVIGSLQNIESAEAAGDKFNTRNSLLVNGVGTLIGTAFGSPFPTTIYIGHPGWKALGARTGYSILNGIFITIVCVFGLMSLIQAIIPVEAVMAILLWIGLIIGAQAFESSPKEHAPAIIIGLFPALAAWGILMVQSSFNYADGTMSGILAKSGINDPSLHISMEGAGINNPILPYTLGGLISLSQGFLLSSMIWASICIFIIDRDFIKAAYWSASGAVLSFLGVIHAFSLSGNVIINNYSIPGSKQFMIGYALFAIVCLVVSRLKTTGEKEFKV
jgi:AGZA family xanthine/uracil permease-like MFS transporter